MKPYKVISLHYTTDCNLNCPMCYRPRETKQNKPHKWFKDLIPYISELTEQVAVGGGEPFMHPEFIRDFSKECVNNGLICNVTTNGTLPMADYIDDIEMVSVSYDRYKYPYLYDYLECVRKIHNKTRVGCNLLMENNFIKYPKMFLYVLDKLFDMVERVFALYPKNWDFIDILKFKAIYYAPTFKYKHFYVDDLTNMILTQNKYQGWDKPCHFARDIISIDERGFVYGCSFDKKPLLKLDKPKDLLNILDVKYKERYSCPYLKVR